jgi:type IV secretion system protein VirB6
VLGNIRKCDKGSILMLLSLFMFILFSYANYANALYDDCIYATDNGDENTKNVVVYAVGQTCNDRCDSECNAFSVTIPGQGTELNSDIIQECKKQCKKGVLYSAYPRVYASRTTGFQFDVRTTLSTIGSACSTTATAADSPEYNEVDSELVVAETEQVSIMLSSAYTNTAYMCGYDIVNIYPSYEAMRDSSWTSNNAYWSPYNTTKSRWSARNTLWTDTGLYIKDDDELSITYGGQLRVCQTVLFGIPYPCSEKSVDKTLWINAPGVSISGNSGSGSVILPGDQLTTVPINSDGSQSSSADVFAIQQANAAITKYGLHGSVLQVVNRYQDIASFSDYNVPYSTGDTNVNSQDVYRTFAGILSGYSSQFSRLAIAHPQDSTSYSFPTLNKNLGGYYVQVIRGGCPYYNGARLQYGLKTPTSSTSSTDYVASTTYSDTVNTWYDIDQATLIQGGYITMPESGKLFFRIQGLEYDPSSAPSCSIFDPFCASSIPDAVELYEPYNRSGQYSVVVSKQYETSKLFQIIQDVVGIVRVYLFGSGQNTTGATGTQFSGGASASSGTFAGLASSQGIVQYLFNRYVASSMLMSTIRATLVLYIAWIGLSFMIGISPMTQKEGLIMMFKVALVVALLAPNSWEFFNTTFFSFFIVGISELIVLVSANPNMTPEQITELQQDPSGLFSVFNIPFITMTSKETWIKVLALMMSGFVGFVMMIVLAVAIIIFLVVLMKATIVYLMSLIGIALLLLLAPIFIPFVLFKFTKPMFDSWIKQLLSFAFQPLFVFVCLIIITQILTLILQVALGFTACSTCLLNFDYVVDSTCLITGYTPLFFQHSPEYSSTFPAGLLAAFLAFMVLSQAMLVFVSFGAKLAISIMTGSFQGVSLDQAASQVIASTQGGVAKFLGVDSGARQGAQRYAEWRNEKKVARKPITMTRESLGLGPKPVIGPGGAPVAPGAGAPAAAPGAAPPPGGAPGLDNPGGRGAIAGLDNPPPAAPAKPLPPIPDAPAAAPAKPLPPIPEGAPPRQGGPQG